MTALRKPLLMPLLLLAALIVSAGVLFAQPTPSGPPNALQGFSQNRDQPVHIEAATLEVRDKQKEATFSGDVRVKQGDTGLRCKSLVVFYEQGGEDASKAKTMPAASPGPGGEQRIKRLEARGGVVVTQKDQTATGELGIFDMKSNTVTLTGNPVIMTQGQNVLRGEKLVVDLTSGVSRVESGKNGQGRVQGLFQGSGSADPKAGASGAQLPRGLPPRRFGSGAAGSPCIHGPGNRLMSRAPLLPPSRFTGRTMLKQLELMRRELANLLSQLPQLWWRRPARRRRVLTPAEVRAQQQAAVNRQARPLQRIYGSEQTHGVTQQRRGGDGRQAARPAYLAAHGVEKSFGGRMVVRGVTLYVRRGEAVGLLGPNGAGKTTVFYMITGLINADRGHIELDGYDVTGLP